MQEREVPMVGAEDLENIERGEEVEVRLYGGGSYEGNLLVRGRSGDDLYLELTKESPQDYDRGTYEELWRERRNMSLSERPDTRKFRYSENPQAGEILDVRLTESEKTLSEMSSELEEQR